MTPRLLARLILVWLAVSAVGSCLAYETGRGEPVSNVVVASAWVAGSLDARAVAESADAARRAIGPTFARMTFDQVTEVGRLGPGPLAAFSFRTDGDGLVCTSVTPNLYLTPDDLKVARAYDAHHVTSTPGVAFGVSLTAASTLLAARSLPACSEWKRARFRRIVEGEPSSIAATGGDSSKTADAKESLTQSSLRARGLAAATYLAENTLPTGDFRYLVFGPTNELLPEYNWVRHAGAVMFLARVAAATASALLRDAAIRSLRRMRQALYVDCGTSACLADNAQAQLGTSALGLLAFVEAKPLGEAVDEEIVALAGFIQSQQRADGEFAHDFDRTTKRAIDVQYPYFTGEAVLALARTHAITHDQATLNASLRGLEYLVKKQPRFFGDRYWMMEEHWTCQALAALWQYQPNEGALEHCLRWHEVQRAYQGPRTLAASDGAFAVLPALFSPRLVPASSRAEAAIATLSVLTRTGRANTAEGRLLREQIDRALGLVMRYQIGPEQSYLMREPGAMMGALGATPSDLTFRIDNAQHSGNAFWSYAALQ